MITKFIYELDEKNRKKIIALVEDEEPNQGYDDFFKTQERCNFTKQENEKATYTSGNYFYIGFNDGNDMKYLDIDILREGVKIRVTDNMVYAACYSLEFMKRIIEIFDGFGFEDYIEIPSYMTLKRNGILDDAFEKIFAKVKVDSYCQINEDNEVKFLAVDSDKQYYLTTNFSKALKVNKRDIRKILVINGFIDEKTTKSDIYFSPFNCFYNPNKGYIVSGKLKLTFEDEVLSIGNTESVEIDYHLVNNEEKNKVLLDIIHLLSSPSKGGSYYLAVNEKYVSFNENYTLVTNPVLSTLFDEVKIEALKLAYSLFIVEPKLQRFNTDIMFIYQNEDNYSFSKEGKDGEGRVIFIQDYEKIKRFIIDDFKEGNNIIIVEDKYVHIDVIDGNSFKMTFEETGFNASAFSLEAANALISAFRWKAKRKEITSAMDFQRLNISNNGETTSYDDILNLIIKNKFRMCAYNDVYDLKVESEKGAVEYLRRFYQKTVFDMEELFTKLLNNITVNNILVVGSGCNLDLIALNNLKIDRHINYSTVETSKWGYFPHINLNKNIIYKGAYRCNFVDLSYDFLKQFDLIVFSKTYKETNISKTLEQILNSDLNVILANVKTSNLQKINDEFYQCFSNYTHVFRKLFEKENIETKIDELKTSLMKSCRCLNNNCSIMDEVLDKKNAYYSVLLVGRGSVKNYFSIK